MAKFFLWAGVIFVILGGILLFTRSSATVVVPKVAGIVSQAINSFSSGTSSATGTTLTASSTVNFGSGDCGVPSQPQLTNPPSAVKAVYLTGWSAGSPTKLQSIIDLIKTTELNAVVIDIKDYSGYVSYAMDVPEVKASGAEDQIRIPCMNGVIQELHDNGIYVIGRITDFQDPVLAKAHPEWAMHNKMTGAVWTDSNGLAWMDPAEQPVWDYLASIAKDAFGRGFDEINFDYVRFATDGSISDISYPAWDQTTPRGTIIADYFKFLRSTFPDKKISADFFGLTTVSDDDMGIGQVIQAAYEYFDYVCPMVYPSHYATGFIGYEYPAAYPYQVIAYSLQHALAKLTAMGNPPKVLTSTSSWADAYDLGTIPQTKLRPWLQDFSLGPTGAPGTVYTADMIRQEKQAVYDTVDATTSSAYYDGWMLWNAANNYTTGALDAK
jgi:hypothetical protein